MVFVTIFKRLTFHRSCLRHHIQKVNISSFIIPQSSKISRIWNLKDFAFVRKSFQPFSGILFGNVVEKLARNLYFSKLFPFNSRKSAEITQKKGNTFPDKKRYLLSFKVWGGARLPQRDIHKFRPLMYTFNYYYDLWEYRECREGWGESPGGGAYLGFFSF